MPHPALKLGAPHVGELVAELRGLCEGLSVRDVQALPPRDLLLVLEPPAGDPPLRLRLSADPEAARLHLQHGRVRSHSGPEGPFFRTLKAELVGARLARLEQIAHDRLCSLSFRETPSGSPRTLVAELVGRHANLLLVDGSERLLAWLVPPPEPAANRSPRLALGEPWSPPPGQARHARDAPPLAELLAGELPAAPGPLAERAPLSWRVECFLGGQAVQRHRERELRNLRERLERKRKRAVGALAGLARRREAALGAERVRQDGELLKAHFGQWTRGMRSIEVDDYFEADAPRRALELDPKLSPADNVERYFRRARKLERSLETLPQEERRAQRRLEALEDLLERARLEAADPAELEGEARRRGLLDAPQEPDARRRKPPAPRLPYRVFRAASGAEIRVGRSARDNDTLTFRHARGNDLWLHTADVPGSHVVLRSARRTAPDEEDVLDAAHLAVHFSPQKGAARAPVHVAHCKEVRKPKGAPAGLVHLRGGKTRDIRVEPERLRRLLDRRAEEPS